MAYRRNLQQGGTYFLTLCLADRNSDLLITHIDRLRFAYQKIQTKMPFKTEAIVILPDHIHALWTLPQDDCDYSNRVRLFKTYFTKQLDLQSKLTHHASRLSKNESGIWQRRFWEHTIRDEQDFYNHFNYIHYNPVKHGWVKSPKDWQFSTFHKMVEQGFYPSDWGSNKIQTIDIIYD